jgi:deazaflavin-dependent oxidoreductase (nitroreductase family)
LGAAPEPARNARDPQRDSAIDAGGSGVSVAPRYVTLLNPILVRLMAVGVPMGPNGLITVRGRRTGLPRTTGVAIIESSGRRWVWAPWGDVNWVRNLRAAGRATITVHGQRQEVEATELDAGERAEFFRDVLGVVARRTPFGATFIRVIDGVDLNRPTEVARDRRVFELRASH